MRVAGTDRIDMVTVFGKLCLVKGLECERDWDHSNKVNAGLSISKFNN